jgi:hypothetical protein
MAVLPTSEGVKKLQDALTKKYGFGNYRRLNSEIGISEKTLQKFIEGKAGVSKKSAGEIIDHFGLKPEEIVPKEDWYGEKPPSLSKLWSDILRIAGDNSGRLGIVKVKVEPTGIRVLKRRLSIAGCPDDDDKFEKVILPKTPIKIEVDIQQEGYLLLLDRDSTGDIFCLSPSPYMPSTKLGVGPIMLPHESAKKPVFKPSTMGDEILVAGIFPEKPDFKWLTEEKCHKLSAEDLEELLEFYRDSTPNAEFLQYKFIVK